MEKQKIVKYYSHLHRKWRYVEVNNETYKFFDCLKKKRKEKRKSRQQRFEESLINYDEFEDFDDSLYFEDKSVNIARQLEEKEFNCIVWKVVDKLDLEQQQIIIDKFINDLDFVEIAEKQGKTKSGITQLFDTIYHHLRILFVNDSEFQKTDYAVCQKEKYLKELKKDFDELKDSIINNLFQNDGEVMSNILSFSKKFKQEIKISEKLKITH